MKIRTTKPKAGNKFYNNSANNGWSWCVTGQPTDRGCNVLSNCVGYACGRFNEIIGKMKYPKFCCNAENFIEVAKEYGLKISKVPVQGGIMVWKKGNSLDSWDGAGHVAICEKDERQMGKGKCLTSESGWNCSTPFWTAIRSNGNGRWGMGAGYSYRGCIVNPAVTQEPPKPRKLRVDGEWGYSTTLQTQIKLKVKYRDGVISNQNYYNKKYMPNAYNSGWEWIYGVSRTGSKTAKAIQKLVKVKADGVIGMQTIKAMQKFLGVKADGILGENTVKGWQKYLNK